MLTEKTGILKFNFVFITFICKCLSKKNEEEEIKSICDILLMCIYILYFLIISHFAKLPNQNNVDQGEHGH